MITNNFLIPLVVILGFFILLFFPSPETNFFAYIGVFLLFILIVIWLALKKNKKK